MIRTTVLIVALALQAAAQSPSPTESLIDVKDLQQCGLVTRYPGDILSPNCFQQSTNILSDRTGVPTRRQGYAQYNGTPCAGNQPVRGLWPFFSQNGTQYLIMQSSASMFYSAGDGTCTVIPGLNGGLSTTATMECTQLSGFLYCADGIDTVFGTNVTSTVAVTQAPVGYHIGAFRNRLLVSGVPGTGGNGSGSQVYLSGELNALDFTIPAVQLTTSPAIISVNGINDGLIVTCLLGEFQNQFLIGRAYDLWGLSGYDLSDFALRKVNDQVGCLEPRSVQEVTNVKYWLSYRGVEGFTGTQINRVSYPIDSQIIPIIAAAGNTRTQALTSQSDWQSGNLTASGPGAPTSATILPGSVVPSTWGVTENATAQWLLGTSVSVSTHVSGAITLTQGAAASFINAGGESSNQTNYTTYQGLLAFSNIADTSFFGSRAWKGTVSAGCHISGSGFGIDVRNSDDSLIYSTVVFLTNGMTNGSFPVNTAGATTPTIYLTVVWYPANSVKSSNFIAGTGLTVNYKDGDSGANCNPIWDIDESQMITSGTYTTQRYRTGFSTPTWGDFNATVSSPTGSGIAFETRVAATQSGALDSAVVPTLGQKILSAQKQYIVSVASFSVNSTTNTAPSISSIGLAAETTGYYITTCIQVSTPTSYGNLLVNGVTNGGAFTFWTSTGATCAIATAVNANWTSQAPNSVITAATTTAYIGERILFYVDVATQVPTINDITFTWNNGTTRPPTASARWDDRYVLFFTTNTAAGAVNDHAFVYDQNQKWQLWDDEYAASAALYQNTLYTGDSNSTGLVYQQDIGQSDNGSSFGMTFQTADLDGGDPNMNKEFSRAYVIIGAPNNNQGAATLSCSYALDGSTSTYSLSPVILSQSPTQNGYFVAKLSFNASQPVTGHWVNLTCSYSGSVGPVSVHRIRLVYSGRGWD